MNTLFHYDYFTLGDVDIPAWHDSFFWPVAREETHALTVDFTTRWARLLEAQDDDFASDCALASVMVPVLFVRAINHFVAVTRLMRSGHVICHNPELRLVPQFLRPEGPFFFPAARLPSALDRGRTKGLTKNFLYSLWYNREKLHKVLDHLDQASCALAFNSENVLFRAHTRDRAEWVRVFSPWEWHGVRGEAPARSLVVLAEMVQQFVAFAQAYARDTLGVPLPPTLAEALVTYARETLGDMAQGYAGLLALMGRSRPRTLFTPTAGNPFTRAASLAARRHGAHVTGFPHGYYICHSDSPRPAFHEMSTVDVFMAYTPGSIPLFQRNLAHFRPSKGNAITIEHDNCTLFRDRFRSFADTPPPERIRSVMVLEMSLIPEWAGYHCAESMVNYHFYYSLCRRLSELGYDVVFKRRPKDLGWGDVNIFKDIPRLRVEYRPFEEPGVLESVDAVVIQYAMSSTLHWSMCTNKPVIYVDSGWEPWYPDVYEKMARRCRVLPCAYDERNRATFSQADLLAAVTPPPTRPDTEYITEYLFPEGSA